MKKITIIMLTVFMFITFGCFDFINPTDEDSDKPRSLSKTEARQVQASNEFSFDIFKELSIGQADSNVFISPLSIYYALGMTYNGAAGETAEEMENTLHLPEGTSEEINSSFETLMEYLLGLDPDVTLQIANSIWYRDTWTFKETFLNICKDYFSAEISGLDFNDPSSVDTINNWVDENTNHKIDNIIDSIDRETVMFLINAIYFNGTWKYEFDSDMTEEKDFYLTDGNTTKCNTMVQTAELKYMSNDDFQAVNLPYGNGNYVMTIILPNSNANIDSIIEEMNSTNWELWMSQMETKKGTVYLPKLKFAYEKELNDALQSLGMRKAFSGADFSNMDETAQYLFISEVRHKSFIEMNEEGTEAAAVTIVEISFESIGEEGDFTMNMNRPFIYAIQDINTNAMLFVGLLNVPIYDE
jgi:serpin B